MSKVTVIVAVYNVEAYIARCIESIIKQTYQDIEILLIDDGSIDKSGNVCDEYAERDYRIRVIHKENGGLSDVRNIGTKEASGHFVMYIDGDDYISCNCVELAVKCAEMHEADVVIFDIEELEEATGRKESWSINIPREQKLNIQTNPELLIMTPSACNKLYRKSLWEKAKLQYPVGRVYEDLTITPQLLLNAERIVYLKSKPLYHYILREGSIMREKNFQRSYENRKAAMEDVLAYFKKKNMFDKYKTELEYMMFEHVYFVPTKEVLYYNSKSEYLNKFGDYVFHVFPHADKNIYIRKWMSKKDRVILFLMKRRQYRAIQLLSKMRKHIDLICKKRR